MANLNDAFDKATDLSKQFDALPGGSNSEYSTLGAGAMGAVKGATFGFDDEIGGIAKALYDKGVGGKKEDFWDLYTKVRDSIRQEHAAAEEQHPVASFAGEMAGGILPMVAAPEALLGKAAIKGADWLTKAKALGMTGAKVGAIAGLGNSNADLTKGQVGQAAADTAGGAASGAILGGVVMPAVEGAVTSVGKGAMNIAKSFPVIGENMETFKRAAAGNDLLGKQNETTQLANQLAHGINDTLTEMRANAGEARDLAIQAASDTGIGVDPHAWADKWIKQAQDKLPGASDDNIQIINDFIKKIKSIVGETTSKVDTYIPLESGLSADELAMQKVQSKMTSSSLADKEQAKQIISTLKEEVASGKLNPNDEADLARMQQLLAKAERLSKGNDFAPEIQKDVGTELEGVINPRGAEKKPVVETIKQNPFDAKVAHIVSEVTDRGVETLTPKQTSDFATELNQAYRGYSDSSDYMGRELFGGAKKDLQQLIKDAAKLPTSAKEDAVQAFNKALESYQEETGNFIGIAKTQESLGQSGFNAADNNVSKLQTMIQNYNKPGSNSKIAIDAALKELAKAYPEEALSIGQLIADTSKNRDIAMGLSAQSPLATNLLHASAKAVMMQIARLGGLAYGGILKYGGGAASNTSGALVNIGNAIYGASPEMIQGMTDKASAMGGAFGNMVAKTLGSIADAPQTKQRAILFTLMQQPDFRKFAQEYISKGDQ